jgi:hypothetical protein
MKHRRQGGGGMQVEQGLFFLDKELDDMKIFEAGEYEAGHFRRQLNNKQNKLKDYENKQI